MRIDNKLNLVIPIESDIGVIYVHSTPISRDIFEQFYMVLSRSFAMIYSKGLHLTAPKIAHLVLKQVATEEGQWPEVQSCLINEIIRLSNVMVPTENDGYKTGTLSDALQRKVISDEEFAEIKGTLVFFCLTSSCHQKQLIQPVLQQMCELYGTTITLLSCMAFKDSLLISTEEQILSQPQDRIISSVPC